MTTGGAGGGDAGPESQLETHWIEQALAPAHGVTARWIGWRLRMLVMLALLGSIGAFALLRSLSTLPHLDATWRVVGQHRIELAASGQPALQPLIGRQLVALQAADGTRLDADPALLQRAPRWIVDDATRARQLALLEQVSRAVQQPQVHLVFDDGLTVDVAPTRRGLGGLGTPFWLLSALGLVLYLMAAVVALAAPGPVNLLYALIAFSQSLNLALIAIESLPGLGLWPGFGPLDLVLRTGCDMLTAGALLHGCLMHPQRLPRAAWFAAGGWVLLALATTGLLWGTFAPAWWSTQALLLACGLATVAVLGWSYRREPHPFAIVLRRLTLAATATLLLLTLAVALASREAMTQQTIATIGSVIWYVFVASLLLLVPFLSRSQQLVREFAMLAGISTVATSLDLLFVAVFALGQFASLTLSLFVALGLYAAARQWLLDQLTGTSGLSAERMFESLYRVAREIEAAPRKAPEQLTRLLRELFEPLELARTERAVSRTRVTGDGSTLVVPVPRLPGAGEDGAEPGTLVLRYARRGRRLFTVDDARLTDRVLEQLRRAVAYDRAVEQGRSEERTRIAQDLHDDIGARLLTLMYKAQSPEMEEYLRHTLQDLKTLTRGLAVGNHRLSHAAAEWKSDITQRLAITGCELHWSFSIDRDLHLSVVQWSGLTRVLRELVNNILAHAQASQVDISAQVERGRLLLVVADDGVGRAPQTWSHGLGLGGVRKRVKLLGGEVHWRENTPRGIVCEVRVPRLG